MTFGSECGLSCGTGSRSERPQFPRRQKKLCLQTAFWICYADCLPVMERMMHVQHGFVQLQASHVELHFRLEVGASL